MIVAGNVLMATTNKEETQNAPPSFQIQILAEVVAAMETEAMETEAMLLPSRNVPTRKVEKNVSDGMLINHTHQDTGMAVTIIAPRQIMTRDRGATPPTLV